MAIDYGVFYSRKGAAYRPEQVVDHSAYPLPVDTRAGRLAGNSRIWGDASHDVQRKVIDAIIDAAKKDGFNIRRMAMLLAMAKIESGFNPDAAAGTTSASGLGQFIKRTGAAYGLNEENRFEVGPSISALIHYFKANEAIARTNKDPDYFVYKYHHDGPTQDYGGAALATNKFAPLAAAYEKALIAGHALSILDPGGQPIADARIKVVQKDKSAVMRTDEHGMLPRFLANPDFGPINVYIKKADDTFKHLGELAIDKLESVWTLIAPNERVALRTHLHEPPKDSGPSASAGTHKVASGETVSRIARDNETTYQELCKLNGISKPYTIYPGQILKIPPKKAGKAASTAPAQLKPPAAASKPAPAALPGKPTVSEKRDEQGRHPVAKVAAPATGTISAAIAYALKHKEAHSIHLCLKYVKRALFATRMIRSYPGIVAAKDFGPFLGKEGFDNLLETRPGTNLSNAPIGVIIVYRHVSDYLNPLPTYRTNPVTMVSPVGSRIPVSYKVIGIWYKEQA